MAGKMGVRTLIHSLLLSTVVATPLNYLFKRASSCSTIHAKSNNGDRKVAIVVDSSGSMSASDPANLRLAAGVDLTKWLISNKEATANVKADLVSVINFDDSPTLDYPLGDPGNAVGAFNGIGALGGTFIARGLLMAIDQIVGGPAPTAQRSGIVVFTDGQVRKHAEREVLDSHFHRTVISLD
jgi:Mg-chelatase subunit ChlD